MSRSRAIRAALVIVLQIDAQVAAVALLNHVEAGEVPLLLQDFGNRNLHVRVRNIDTGVLGLRRVAHPGQHVRNGISCVQQSCLLFTSSP